MVLFFLDGDTALRFLYLVLESPSDCRFRLALDVGLEPEVKADLDLTFLKVLAVDLWCHCKRENVC